MWRRRALRACDSVVAHPAEKDAGRPLKNQQKLKYQLCSRLRPLQDHKEAGDYPDVGVHSRDG